MGRNPNWGEHHLQLVRITDFAARGESTSRFSLLPLEGTRVARGANIISKLCDYTKRFIVVDIGKEDETTIIIEVILRITFVRIADWLLSSVAVPVPVSSVTSTFLLIK